MPARYIPTPAPPGRGSSGAGKDYNYSIPYISTPVNIGSVPMGGDYPIRIQSMTNTDTLDTKASVAQCIRIIEAGADYVRLTAQGIKEAENLANIRSELRRGGFDTPLIADIHFNPIAAETAARIVEKVRINPGNYADKRAAFEKTELTDRENAEELERIHARLLPLIKICRHNGTAIRVGINHGSLSDRIMTRYGNTTKGMVVSALEFISIFRSENFNDLVLSMKSSDTSVMTEASRQLVAAMQAEKIAYPVHLGVTEAGEGEDGRVRSAAGIGALLAEGIGDTIRVSLSEDPELEIPVALKLASYYPRGYAAANDMIPLTFRSPAVRPECLKKITGPIVVTRATSHTDFSPEDYRDAGFAVNDDHTVTRTDNSADIILSGVLPSVIPDDTLVALPFNLLTGHPDTERLVPVFSQDTLPDEKTTSEKLNLILLSPQSDIETAGKTDPSNTLFIFSFDPDNERYAPDRFLGTLEKNNLQPGVILNPVFRENDIDDLRIRSAALLGRFLIDRRIAGIFLENNGKISKGDVTATAFSILQCTGTRITRTMYLSCPTCGRTKFNLQEAVRKVRAATGHLKGLKIAVMGCIVNGPGEMAGSDYGYVGAANGKVHIYRGTTPVLKNIPEKDAAMALLRLIEQDRSL